MKAHIEGREVELVENWRVGELIEAENAVGVDMWSATGAGRMALVIFISMRREDPNFPQAVLAGKVKMMEITSILPDEDEEADPLVDSDDRPATNGSDPGQSELLIDGRLS